MKGKYVFVFQIADRCQEQLAQASTLDPADRRAAVVYADTLTILFEDVGKVVEIHQPLVETYYGRFSDKLSLENE